MKDWDLAKDPFFIGQLLKQSQQTGASVNDVAARLATTLKQQISEPGKEEAKQSDDMQVDGLPAVLNSKNWDQKGTIPLTLADLKSPEDFHQWCSDEKISTQVDNQPVAAFGDKNFNQCVAIQVIYNRAQFDANNATPASKGWTANYLQAIKQLASQTHCSLISPAGNAQTNPDQAALSVDQTLGRALSPAPLTRSMIDFNRINTYLDQITPLLSHTKFGPSIQNMIAQTKGLMAQVNAISPSLTYSLAYTTQTFLNYVNGNPGNYLVLVKALRSIIWNVHNTLDALRAAFGQQIQDNAQLEQLIAGQIGRSTDDDSIWQDNDEQLANLAKMKLTSEPA